MEKGEWNDKKMKGGGEIRHTSPHSEARGPIMALASAVRRGRGHDVRTDVNAGTRKVKGTNMTT